LYRVEFLASAAKEFRSFAPKDKRRIAVAIEKLAENPRPRGAKKLHGYIHLYRIRVGDIRIIYEIRAEEKLIVITRVRKRSTAYR